MFYITGTNPHRSGSQLQRLDAASKQPTMKEIGVYMSEEEEEVSYHIAISTDVTSRCLRGVECSSVTSETGSDGVVVNSPVAARFDAWSDDDECFASDPVIACKESFRKSWTDSGVSSTRTDSQPGSLVNRVKKTASPSDLVGDFQTRNVYGSPNERRSLREIKSPRRRRAAASREKSNRASCHLDRFREEPDHMSTASGLPACDGTSALVNDVSAWTSKEREILCKVLENARDLGVTKKPAVVTNKEKKTKESSKKKELMDYPLSQYRNSENEDKRKSMKSGKSLLSGLRKISQGLKRRKDSTSLKRNDQQPQDIVYHDYISRYLDPSDDESGASDNESDELSRLGNAPKKVGLFKRVFQRRSSRSYVASSASIVAVQGHRHLDRSSSATPRLRRERSVSTPSIPDTFRGMFSRNRAQSVELLHESRRRMPRSRSVISLALRSPSVPTTQRFGGSTTSLNDKNAIKGHRRYDSVRSLLQPTTHCDIATHVIGDDMETRHAAAMETSDYNVENIRRRRMSTGQRAPKGYLLDDFFPTAVHDEYRPTKASNDATKCSDFGYDSCYDEAGYRDDASVDSFTDDSVRHSGRRRRNGTTHVPAKETVIAPLAVQVTQKKIAAKRHIGYGRSMSVM